MFRILIAGLLLCLAADDPSAKLSDEKIINSCQKMDEITKKAMEKLNIPGAVYVVSRRDKIIHTAAFGKTSVGKDSKAVTEHTVFPISSLSKNVTAILVGSLVEENKISLDDKVRKYLPDFFLGTEEISKEITVRDLISHRSGFKHFAADSLFCANYDNEKIIKAFKILKPRPGKFRKEYGYQNIIFGIVGDILEKATGEKYEDLVKKYIFDKISMSESSCIPLICEENFFSYFKHRLSKISYEIEKYGFFTAVGRFFKSITSHKNLEIATNHSRYRDTLYPLEQNDFFQKFSATSAVGMSANDFAKWLLTLANEGSYNLTTICSEKTFKELISRMVDIDNIKDDDATFPIERFERKGMYYGCGIFSSQYSDSRKNGRRIFFHMGGVYGCACFFAYSPEDDIAVGFLCNLGGVSHTLFSEYMTLEFLDLCFDFSKINWAEQDARRKELFEKKKKEFRDAINRNISSMEEIEKYIGTYTSDLYGDIKIYEKNKELFLSNGIRALKLKHFNGSVFEFPEKDLFYSYFDADEYAMFSKDKYGNVNALRLTCFHENDSEFKKKEG